jgi:hypothetical protein
MSDIINYPVVIPDQTGNAGDVLGTDGSKMSWQVGGGGGGITQLTTDVTAGPGSGSQVATIAANAVTTAKILDANVTLAKVANIADATFLGNNSGAPAAPLALTVAQTKTALNLAGSNTGDQTITLTTDVTGSGTGSFAATIAAGAVTLAKQANLAANSIQGNNTGSPATPLALTAAQTNTLLGTGTIITALSGDVTATGSGQGSVAATIANAAVSLAKMANLAANSVIGNNTGSSATPIALTTAQLKTLAGYYTSGDSPTFAALTLTAFSGALSAAAGVISAGTLSEANGGNGSTTKPGHYTTVVSSAVATSCTGSATTVIPFATVTTNVGSAWTSPTYTVPVTGAYQINFHLRITIIASTAMGLTAGIFVGGALRHSFGPGVFTSSVLQVTCDITGAALVALTATNTVDIRVVNSNATARALNGTATDNILSVVGPF